MLIVEITPHFWRFWLCFIFWACHINTPTQPRLCWQIFFPDLVPKKSSPLQNLSSSNFCPGDLPHEKIFSDLGVATKERYERHGVRHIVIQTLDQELYPTVGVSAYSARHDVKSHLQPKHIFSTRKRQHVLHSERWLVLSQHGSLSCGVSASFSFPAHLLLWQQGKQNNWFQEEGFVESIFKNR